MVKNGTDMSDMQGVRGWQAPEITLVQVCTASDFATAMPPVTIGAHTCMPGNT
jgi:hypothetical protein